MLWRRPINKAGLIRVHRATLISSAAAIVMDQQLIRRDTNEMGIIQQTLNSLFAHYQRTKLLEYVTMDAGNSSRKVSALITRRRADYLLALKFGQGHIFADAREWLGAREGRCQ